MNIEETKDKLIELFPKYDALGKNLVQAIKLLLDKNNIKYISVYYRTKETNSFIEKIERKSYEDPFVEIEDICGVRIICYYHSDINKISAIISKEFDVFDSEDKEDKLNEDQFGYRSFHLIASIKKEWTKVPNYSDLNDLKAEIQIRTILMHAWAEIEHNLAYKSEAHVPAKFKRKLFRISAKLEEADEQFEELKLESGKFQEELLKQAKNNTLQFDNETAINLDTLQAFLNFNFPKRKKNLEMTSTLLNEIIKYKFKLGDIAEAYKKLEPHIAEIEHENFKNNDRYSRWSQVGLTRFIMKMISKDYALANGMVNSSNKFREKYFLN